MSFKVEASENFARELKRLAKKYLSLKNDVSELLHGLSVDPLQGTALGRNCFKIRLAIKSKGKGKSGGARVISCVIVVTETVMLLSIYDKSEIENISSQDLTALINSNTGHH
ncbi:type II toxin-antitoxin system RelE family toxin [Dyadobacter sp. MSC1_007]|jgi:mRNA-degrading endonuclease RelE of RelBE toxin-antitoxin system|uniref:type II toxin-antitoxin system RelE family toxin n=1 Tax=Dyadobacter sp. MSC1_007 TaxID=2909264 RepID=UPI00202F0028|nr:type II toxin-antitoxin system RelE/ParE family toxin [Dyadobacter sp. MSC1_007]